MIRRIGTVRLSGVLLSLLLGCLTVQAEDVRSTVPDTAIVRVTTHPAVDIEPAVSPDGRWVAFASNRSGNFDIWVKPVEGGVAYRITSHPADDRQPRWTHDGHGVLFVSQRSDPNGDIWRIDIRRRGNVAWSYGKPRCLTPRVCYDAQPDAHPNGKFAVFVSDRSGEAAIWLLKLKNRHTHLLWRGPALWPRWSPDGRWLAWIAPDSTGWSLHFAAFDAKRDTLGGPVFTVQGPEGQPVSFDWNPFGAHLACLVKMQPETTLLHRPNNGAVWILPAPDSVVTRLPAKMVAGDTLPRASYRLSYPTRQFLGLCWRHGRYVIVTAGSDSTSDLLRWPASGRIPKQATPGAQLRYAEHLGASPTHLRNTALRVPKPTFLWKKIEAFARVVDFHTARSPNTARALYAQACTAWLAGDPTLAQLALTRLRQLPAEPGDLTAAAALLHADLRAFSPGRTLLTARCVARDSLALTTYRRLFTNPATPVRIRAFAALRLGQIDAHQHRAAALALLDTLSVLFPLQRDITLAAWLEIARVQAHTNPVEAHRHALAVLRQASTYPELATEAVQLLLTGGTTSIASVEDSLQAALALADTLDSPAGALHLRLWVATRALARCDTALAERALLGIHNLVVHTSEVRRRFLTLRARLYLLKGQPSGALAVLRTAPLDSVPPALVVRAFTALGDSLSQTGNPRRAYRAYKRAWPYASSDAVLHRKLVLAALRAGKLADLTAAYAQARRLHPENPVFDYAYGLCLYYQATANAIRTDNPLEIDIGSLKTSLHVLELTLRKNSSLVPAYLALAKDYEALETALAARQQKKTAWIGRATRFVFAPAIFAFKTITRRRGEPKRRYYERAIDALTIALQINDERKNPRLEADLYESLAHNTFALGQYSYRQALVYFEKRLALDSTFSSPEERLRFFERMGHCAFFAAKYALAAWAFDNAVITAEKLHRQNVLPALLTDLGTALSFAGNHQKAMTVFHRLLRFPTTLSSPYHRERAYRNLALAHLGAAQIDSALWYVAKALALLESGAVTETKRPAVRLRIAFLGWVFPVPFLDLRRYGLVPAQAGPEDLTRAEEMALLLQIQSDALLYRGQLAGVIRALSGKSAAFKKAGDRSARAVVENNLGVVCMLADLPEQAWAHLVRAWNLAEDASRLEGQVQNVEALVEMLRLRLTLHPPSTMEALQRLQNDARTLRTLIRRTHKALTKTGVRLPSLDVRLSLANIRFRQTIAPLFSLVQRDSTVYLSSPPSVPDTLVSLAQHLAALRDRVDSLALPVLSVRYLQTEAAILQNLGDVRRAYRALNQLRLLAEARGDTAEAARQEIRIACLLAQVAPSQRVALRAGWQPEALARRGALRLVAALLKNRSAGPADRQLLHAAATVQILASLNQKDPDAAFRIVRRFHNQLAALLLAPYHPRKGQADRIWSLVFQQLRDQLLAEAETLQPQSSAKIGLAGGSGTAPALDSLRLHLPALYRAARTLLAPPAQPRVALYAWCSRKSSTWFLVRDDSVRVFHRKPPRSVATDSLPVWPDPLNGRWADTLFVLPTAEGETTAAGTASLLWLHSNAVQPLYSFVLAPGENPVQFRRPTLAELLFSKRSNPQKLLLTGKRRSEVGFLLRWLRTATADIP